MYKEIKEFVAKNYELDALKITKLEGYGSENYKIETEKQKLRFEVL